jgi:chorismate mutase
MAAQTRIRALRGATTVEQDDAAALYAATRELLERLAILNDFEPAQVVSALFTVTPDLHSAFPAAAARELGWTDVPLLCATEIGVPGALAQCIRVLITLETARDAPPPRHVYLRGARLLRPDLPATDYLP